MIEVLAGTNRPGSNTLKVAHIIEGLYKKLGADVQVLSLESMPPEIFQPTSYVAKPEGWKKITDRILNADGVHVVTPEYNGGFPGVLKYFIDMLPFPASFESRCVAFTGIASGVWGAFRPVEQLQMIFAYRNAFILPQRVWITGITNKLDEQGHLTDSAATKMLESQTEKFVDFTKRHEGQAVKAE